MKDGNYKYEIVMEVPLGKRNGLLEITVSENKLSGFLTMFTERLPIANGYYAGTQLAFSGRMKTLLRTFDYTATGSITKEHIELIFHTERGDYPAAGRMPISTD